MAYRIPSTERVRDAVRRVLSRDRSAASLHELTRLVRAELEEDDPRFRVGPERIRRLASRMNAVRTSIHTRRGATRDATAGCPVCGGRLEVVRNRTLRGDDVALEARCTECPYWTGREKRVPVRYAFHLREWRFAKAPRRRPEGPIETE